jgi:hypothetical protein
MQENTREESSGSHVSRLLESIVNGPVFGGRKAVERVIGRLSSGFHHDGSIRGDFENLGCDFRHSLILKMS